MDERIKNKIESHFSKKCINSLEATYHGKPMKYVRRDLTKWAAEAFDRGEKYFYVEPVNGEFYELVYIMPMI